ncbi:HEAT repeat domain-containing protein [Bradyrhizobium sp.]|jgi:HEAT repeat protein|uniref:HEAT repeat domain-containing protein n=1 Tax=Bradyrhizobium sp. TaxID=376 RepID=UPI002DDD5669|nr:HEAT repeat domain-containing protein [Bradyrhizobium sp.]HEV2159546.1 HEAT repeat domain-containing protein [Bradyrhizobium sp.]
MTNHQPGHDENAQASLAATVSAFRSWADSLPAGQRSGEWECDYQQWPAITKAFAAFLDSLTPQLWDSSNIEMLLYILARDNEMELLKEELTARPIHLLALAKVSFNCEEPDARWQLADALGSVELATTEVEPLLERYFRDENEYVSRRALLALARRQSKHAEPFALRAWGTGHEYQRMAALEALVACGSPLLSSHLDFAFRDGRQHLVKSAQALLAKRTIERSE